MWVGRRSAEPPNFKASAAAGLHAHPARAHLNCSAKPSVHNPSCPGGLHAKHTFRSRPGIARPQSRAMRCLSSTSRRMSRPASAGCGSGAGRRTASGSTGGGRLRAGTAWRLGTPGTHTPGARQDASAAPEGSTSRLLLSNAREGRVWCATISREVAPCRPAALQPRPAPPAQPSGGSGVRQVLRRQPRRLAVVHPQRHRDVHQVGELGVALQKTNKAKRDEMRAAK